MVTSHDHLHHQRRPMCFWTQLDVLKWMQRHALALYIKYVNVFASNHICGRVLVQLTDADLRSVGITDTRDRTTLLFHINRCKLRSDYDELLARQ